MKYWLAFLALIALVLPSCKKENTLYLRNLPVMEKFLPDFKNDATYISNAGDTIKLYKVEEKTYFDNVNGTGSQIGTLGAYDKINLMRHQMAFQCDSPFYRVEYLLSSEYDPQSITNQQDQLHVSYFEQTGVETTFLQLNYTDTVTCQSSRCNYADTLALHDSVKYAGVYYLTPEVGKASIYINKTESGQRLLGFTTTDNKTFKLSK